MFLCFPSQAELYMPIDDFMGVQESQVWIFGAGDMPFLGSILVAGSSLAAGQIFGIISTLANGATFKDSTLVTGVTFASISILLAD